MNKPDIRFTTLFKAYVEDRCTNEERKEFLHLITLDSYKINLQTLIDQEVENNDPNYFSTPEEADKLFGKILHETKNVEFLPARHQEYNRFLWWSIAASVLVLFTVGTLFLFNHQNRDTQLPTIVKNDIAPGSNKAILTLADGSTIVLNNATTGKIAEQGATSVLKEDAGKISYQSAKTDRLTPITYNTLTIPRGGQYQLTLPDGTKVWLNAASSITFPTAFAGTERRVKITGEAYFEVTKNAMKPFIVSIKDENEIKVLGTHFNVNAYNDESAIRTTLLEGRVQILSKQKPSAILTPGEQASINFGSGININNVDTDEVVAWKNGLFQFSSEDIGSIMHQISRWYDVEVAYEATKPNIRLSGIISRNVNVSSVLKMLELSGVKFRIEGKKITVLP